MAWLTHTVVKLDRAGRQALERAAFEENVRLALWRMDSAMTVLIGLENARPFSSYKYLTNNDATLAYKVPMADRGEQLTIPNPSSDILLHFQFDPDGKLSSSIADIPSSGEGREVDQSEDGWVPGDAPNFESLKRFITQKDLLASIEYNLKKEQETKRTIRTAATRRKPAFVPTAEPVELATRMVDEEEEKDEIQDVSEPAGGLDLDGKVAQGDKLDELQVQLSTQSARYRQNKSKGKFANLKKRVSKSEQKTLSLEEQNVRNEFFNQANVMAKQQQAQMPTANQDDTGVIAHNKNMPVQQSIDANKDKEITKGDVGFVEDTTETIRVPKVSTIVSRTYSTEAVHKELMQPIWVKGALFLARRVKINDSEYIQGCWMNWDAIQKTLLSQVVDLLPNAQLLPVTSQPDSEQTRLLASIPATLIPGPMPMGNGERPTLLHLFLGMAWVGVLIAAVAIGAVLVGATTLSNRRGAFVSAVTHELRTPLTTFRMYTEMLDEGMVNSEEQKAGYISTLHNEAERLGHLVENVLAYAQLEKNKKSVPHNPVSISDLIQRITSRLNDRAAQSEMALEVQADEKALPLQIRADISAVERIIFNLVDNASKYASSAEDRRIILRVGTKGKNAVFKVRDFGPGVSSKFIAKMYKPFSKSAKEAADSAPGVGLGLNISRRLAKQMGGDLSFDRGITDGACFVLSLPLA